jgi:predicted amidohydrolase YtcJ
MSKDRIYVNGDVVTMEPDSMKAEAFLVSQGRFGVVGTVDRVRSCAPSGIEMIDLGGKTVVPGFIETHNHLSSYALTLVMADCTPGANTRIRDIQDKVHAMAKSTGPGQWVVGWGYDDTQIEEMRHLHRADLDKAAPENPVFIYHASGHLSYANTMALKLGNVTKNTPQPQGGTIHKDGDGEPTGLLMEPAAQHLVAEHLPRPDVSIFMSLLPEAIGHYNRMGVTSTHDAAIGIHGQGMGTVRAYRQLEKENRLNIRVYLTTLYPVYDQLLELGLGHGFGSDHVKIGSVKMFQDGSIQALTAALSHDYYNKPGFRGELIMPQAAMESLVEKYHREKLQVAVHANGDAAIESVILAMEKAQAEYPQSDLRHMVIHCQTATDDQIRRMKHLGIIPSYFPGHVYYWGDRHQSLFLGPERAARIDPLGSSVRQGLRFTLHADTPVTPVSPLFSMHCAVNRITRDGHLLGPDERIPPYEALKAFTTDAAYCSYEEDLKGSIRTGKLADFVVLSSNPLTCLPEKIGELKVLKTVIGGKEVYTGKG